MKYLNYDYKESSNKWFSLKDVHRLNIENSPLYTNMQKIKAERMKMVLDMIYQHKGIHVNYRKKFIAVKVTRGLCKDRALMKECERAWSEEGIEKVSTEQGIVYHLFGKKKAEPMTKEDLLKNMETLRVLETELAELDRKIEAEVSRIRKSKGN